MKATLNVTKIEANNTWSEEMGAQRSIDERARYVEDAKTSAFLDAVYVILSYNSEKLPFAPKQSPITPSEIFGNFDQAEFQKCLQRCVSMKLEAGNVAMADYGYAAATQSYEEALKHFKASNPGFSNESYGSALWSAKIAFR